MNFEEFSSAKTKADAKDRAWRTFLQNIWLDLGVIVGPLLVDAVTKWDGSFTGSYWTGVGITVAKTAATVVLAYWMRMKKPPAV